jgi:hypothetical protein
MHRSVCWSYSASAEITIVYKARAELGGGTRHSLLRQRSGLIAFIGKQSLKHFLYYSPLICTIRECVGTRQAFDVPEQPSPYIRHIRTPAGTVLQMFFETT